MNKNLRISIIIPVYNEALYLEACLESIARQTVKPFEVIVVDNNSTDDTVQIAQRFGFVRILHEKHQGVVFARNRGFNAAEGDILARIDADTVLPSGWLALARESFTDTTCAAQTGEPRFNDVLLPKVIDATQVMLYQHLQKFLTGSWTLWGANMAVRRSVWRKVRTSTTTKPGVDEDVDLSLCIAHAGYRVGFDLLPVEASFMRGNLGYAHSARYLISWPKDYIQHRMFVRAGLVGVLITFALFTVLPFGPLLTYVGNAFRLAESEY